MSLRTAPPRLLLPHGAPSGGPSREIYVPPVEARDRGIGELLFTAETVAICVVAALLVLFLVTDRRSRKRRARHRR
ncbi:MULTISPECIES: hypothetical protein [unclassified Streptomyces]|uniref:hypothetical protein n=1 Tax=unclassified Streptomyces TaxID=2593676 RepID=UPI00037F20C7|nr:MULTISPECIES: hypothetical protein [unclassified Streptomyces]MYX39181.1 hypothetical protein [Streptomyces sp. SID8377]